MFFMPCRNLLLKAYLLRTDQPAVYERERVCALSCLYSEPALVLLPFQFFKTPSGTCHGIYPMTRAPAGGGWWGMGFCLSFHHSTYSTYSATYSTYFYHRKSLTGAGWAPLKTTSLGSLFAGSHPGLVGFLLL